MNELLAHSICAKCGGACCKFCGCMLHPDNISIPFRYNKLFRKLKTGHYSFYIVVFQERTSHLYNYQLRLRTRNVDRDIIDIFSVPNQCMHWNAEEGCKSFTDHTRPYGGLHLVPFDDYQCTPDYTTYDAFEWWEAYQFHMERAFHDFSHGFSVLDILQQQYNNNVEAVKEFSKTNPSQKAFLESAEALLKQENLL